VSIMWHNRLRADDHVFCINYRFTAHASGSTRSKFAAWILNIGRTAKQDLTSESIVKSVQNEPPQFSNGRVITLPGTLPYLEKSAIAALGRAAPAATAAAAHFFNKALRVIAARSLDAAEPERALHDAITKVSSATCCPLWRIQSHTKKRWRVTCV
jgi:hypothetical protein